MSTSPKPMENLHALTPPEKKVSPRSITSDFVSPLSSASVMDFESPTSCISVPNLLNRSPLQRTSAVLRAPDVLPPVSSPKGSASPKGSFSPKGAFSPKGSASPKGSFSPNSKSGNRMFDCHRTSDSGLLLWPQSPGQEPASTSTSSAKCNGPVSPSKSMKSVQSATSATCTTSIDGSMDDSPPNQNEKEGLTIEVNTGTHLVNTYRNRSPQKLLVDTIDSPMSSNAASPCGRDYGMTSPTTPTADGMSPVRVPGWKTSLARNKMRLDSLGDFDVSPREQNNEDQSPSQGTKRHIESTGLLPMISSPVAARPEVLRTISTKSFRSIGRADTEGYEVLQRPYHHVFLDFDHVLSNVLLGVRTKDSKTPPVEGITCKEFGGEARVRKIQELFELWQALGVHFCIISKGRYKRIRTCLERVDLLKYVKNILCGDTEGDMNQKNEKLDKREQISRVLSAASSNNSRSDVLFIDDSFANLCKLDDMCMVYQPDAGENGQGLSLEELDYMLENARAMR